MKTAKHLCRLIKERFRELCNEDEQLSVYGPFPWKELNLNTVRKRFVRTNYEDMYFKVTLKTPPPETHYSDNMLVTKIYVSITEIAEAEFPQLAVSDFRRIISQKLRDDNVDQKCKVINKLIRLLEERKT